MRMFLHVQTAPRQQGLTLVEILLSVALIGIIGGLSFPVYESVLRNNDLDLVTHQMQNMVYRAQTFARTSYTDSEWSLHLEEDVFTLYQGSDFENRDDSFDDVVALVGSVIVEGTPDVTFMVGTGQVSEVPTWTVRSGSDERVITVNTYGVIQ